MKYLIYMISKIIMNPRCLIRNYRTNNVWDKMVLEQLKNPAFTGRDSYTVKLNGVEIWIENHPYASVKDYSGKNKGLTSRYTSFKFMDELNKAT